jgi:hypothetical protein
MTFYLLERNSQSPAEANYPIWYLVKIGEFERMNSSLLGHCWVHAVDNLFRDYLGFS